MSLLYLFLFPSLTIPPSQYSDLVSTRAICNFSVWRVSDRWQLAQISQRQGVTAAKHCLSSLMCGGNQCRDKPLVMLRQKALTSSAAYDCFDNLITIVEANFYQDDTSCLFQRLSGDESCHLCLAVTWGKPDRQVWGQNGLPAGSQRKNARATFGHAAYPPRGHPCHTERAAL